MLAATAACLLGASVVQYLCAPFDLTQLSGASQLGAHLAYDILLHASSAVHVCYFCGVSFLMLKAAWLAVENCEPRACIRNFFYALAALTVAVPIAVVALQAVTNIAAFGAIAHLWFALVLLVTSVVMCASSYRLWRWHQTTPGANGARAPARMAPPSNGVFMAEVRVLAYALVFIGSLALVFISAAAFVAVAASHLSAATIQVYVPAATQFVTMRSDSSAYLGSVLAPNIFGCDLLLAMHAVVSLGVTAWLVSGEYTDAARFVGLRWWAQLFFALRISRCAVLHVPVDTLAAFASSYNRSENDMALRHVYERRALGMRVPTYSAGWPWTTGASEPARRPPSPPGKRAKTPHQQQDEQKKQQQNSVRAAASIEHDEKESAIAERASSHMRSKSNVEVTVVRSNYMLNRMEDLEDKAQHEHKRNISSTKIDISEPNLSAESQKAATSTAAKTAALASELISDTGMRRRPSSVGNNGNKPPNQPFERRSGSISVPNFVISPLVNPSPSASRVRLMSPTMPPLAKGKRQLRTSRVYTFERYGAAAPQVVATTRREVDPVTQVQQELLHMQPATYGVADALIGGGNGAAIGRREMEGLRDAVMAAKAARLVKKQSKIAAKYMAHVAAKNGAALNSDAAQHAQSSDDEDQEWAEEETDFEQARAALRSPSPQTVVTTSANGTISI